MESIRLGRWIGDGGAEIVQNPLAPPPRLALTITSHGYPQPSPPFLFAVRGHRPVTMASALHLHLVSDSTGETLEIDRQGRPGALRRRAGDQAFLADGALRRPSRSRHRGGDAGAGPDHLHSGRWRGARPARTALRQRSVCRWFRRSIRPSVRCRNCSARCDAAAGAPAHHGSRLFRPRRCDQLHHGSRRWRQP